MKTVNVVTTSTVIATGFAGRAFLGLQNNSAIPIYLKFDAQGIENPTVAEGWVLAPGESLFLGPEAASGQVSGIVSSGSATIHIQGA